jgi:hypothetical protein
MNNMQMQIGKMMATGPSRMSSMLGSALQPLYSEQQGGLDLNKSIMGVSVYLSGIDSWGDPKKKVGR